MTYQCHLCENILIDKKRITKSFYIKIIYYPEQNIVMTKALIQQGKVLFNFYTKLDTGKEFVSKYDNSKLDFFKNEFYFSDV